MSTSSSLIFLNAALLTSIFRTETSVALPSCQAELYAANGLLVEIIFMLEMKAKQAMKLCNKGFSWIRRRHWH